MYKHKLLYFASTIAVILLLLFSLAGLSAHLSRENLQQSNIAQSLLFEHERLSGTSYRLFKQLTDEVILGREANQAFVRDKRSKIKQSIATIRELEQQQRDALGVRFTQGSVEDTDELKELIEQIIRQFDAIVQPGATPAMQQQEQLRNLLEVTIDGRFRELINTAVNRQSSVVASINARANTLNTAMLWSIIGFGVLSLIIIIYGCYWLFNQLHLPVTTVRLATHRLASGDYDEPIKEKLDGEFNELATSINHLGDRLKEHDLRESQSRRKLETEVEQRTTELTKANHALTKIDTRRRQFIADISHELRTPLTIIRGEAQVTLRMPSARQEDYTETLSAILDQSINLSNLVDDLLFLTRAEMHEVELQRRSASLTSLLAGEVERWQKRSDDREVTFVSGSTDDIYYSVDSQRILQALSILIDNAAKYSRAGGPIHIELNEDDSHVLIAVSDTGDGISAAEIENIFERFVRFSRHDEGMGLGLSIAKAIVEAHKGTISVESAQGEGATFTIDLPKELKQ